MKHLMYSVRDSKTTYGLPFFDLSDASAKRGFSYAFYNQSSLVGFSPADFSLYRIGYFDSDSSETVSYAPVFICSASDFINMKGDDVVEE